MTNTSEALADLAKVEYKADNPFWAASLVVDLEASHPGSALMWAFSALTSLAQSICPPPTRDKILNWSQHLLTADSRAAEDSIQEIWLEAGIAFPFILKALANFIGAKIWHLRGDSGKYRYYLISGLNLLGQDDYCRKFDGKAIFHEYLNSK